MATRSAAESWLTQLTALPTAPGHETAVVEWVERWVGRRPDIRVRSDGGGNLLVTQKGRRSREPVVAVAHMDHPGFVIEDVDGRYAHYEFRGGVDAPYFASARVEIFTSQGSERSRVVEHDPVLKTGRLLMSAGHHAAPGDIGRWLFPDRKPAPGRLLAPACDDLAGAAAALAALDKARHNPRLRHFSVLLTRAEEVGLVGAMHAAVSGTIPSSSRVLSIETSRELPDALIGEGPIIRVGDALTVFDARLTNLITQAARRAGLPHQRRLMSGGTCEASAFVALGYRSTGLCLALGNWHNRGNLAAVEAGTGRAIVLQEEISLQDFHGLVELLLLAARAVDEPDAIADQLETHYRTSRGLLA